MGQKGAKLTQNTTTVCEDLPTDLDSIDAITSLKMLVGFGISYDKKIFAIVTSKAKVCVKLYGDHLAKFLSEGSHQFGKMLHYSALSHIRKDLEKWEHWARISIEISQQNK